MSPPRVMSGIVRTSIRPYRSVTVESVIGSSGVRKWPLRFPMSALQASWTMFEYHTVRSWIGSPMNGMSPWPFVLVSEGASGVAVWATAEEPTR